MKKPLILLLALCLLLGCLPARADTARDVGAECALAYQDNSLACGYLVDHDYVRGDNLASKVEHIFYVTPGKTPVAQIEVFFGTHMLPYRVERQDGAGWATVARVTEARAQSYVRLEPIAEKFRIVFSDGQRSPLTLKEILLFSEGETEGTALKPWRDPCEKADVMTLVAHPDDELLWFGGLLPTYAGERQLRVQAVYMTCENALRRQELLNGLWHCGVRSYPDIADFEDYNYQRVDYAYRAWGKENILSHLVRLLRRYQPEAVVTHDLKGEYGHTQHIVCSETVLEAASRAADASYDPDSARQYGVWQVKKVYCHLGDAPTTRMDWSQPLSFFNGRTGLEVAAEAFQLHVTQTWSGKFAVAAPGDSYDSTVYTLAYSTVGEDARGGDFLENIPLESLSNYIPEATNQ